MKICSVEGCERDIKTRGFCEMHYKRVITHGSPHYVNPRFHGFRYHPLYQTWSNMMRRCYLLHERQYKDYGGRGIEVCKRWHNVELFIKDIGERPIGATLDRINNNGNYCPDNVRWATRQIQNQNSRAAILNADLVRDIRAVTTKRNKKEIARKYGIALPTINDVLAYRTWKNIR